MSKKAALILLLLPTLFFPRKVFAVGSGGFENASFSAKSLGQSNAAVAQADEPAAISYNPAGIAYLPGLQIQPNMNLLSIFTFYDSDFRNQGTTRSSGTIVPVPTGYLTVNPGEVLGDRVTFGIGSDSPFGLSNKYDSTNPIVRYVGWRNWLKMYTIKPVIAAKITDWLSVGGGPMYYRIFDYGGIQAYPNRLFGVAALAADGQVRLNLSGNHWGWHMGVLAKPHKMHQLGFYFRSPVVVHTRGTIKVENSLALLTGVARNFETGGDAKLSLPLNFTFAYALKPTERDTVEIDFGYTRWSTHERVFIGHNQTGVLANDTIILNAIGRGVDNAKDYSDGYSLHLGGNHKFTDQFSLRGGTLFYWKSVPNDHFTLAIPDSNRLAFSLGTSYGLTKNILVDAVYLAGFNLRKRIDNRIGDGVATSLDGKYHSLIQELSIAFTFKWDDLFSRMKTWKTPAPPAKLETGTPPSI